MTRPSTEERRWVTVLFADLSGFTRLSERMDPEDVRLVADAFQARAGSVVSQLGGLVAGVMADGVLAVFGAPVAHEDDAERAVRAALELQRCALEQPADFAHLPLRVGVNTGEVVFAPVGPAGRRELTVMGDVVNTASRLQGVAPVGGVLVADETRRACGDSVLFEPADPVAVKGKDTPLTVWLALGAAPAPAERSLSPGPMVGRDGELAALEEIWSQVMTESRSRLVTIMGPPGIGKTKLGRVFCSVVEEAGARVVKGRCLPYGESTGYGAFAQQVRDLAGILQTDQAPVARQKLAVEVGRLVSEAAAESTTSSLGILLGLREAGETADRNQLFAAARRFVESLSAKQPVVLVFEDVHWADASLLDLIEFLVARLRSSPALLLTLSRPELLDTRTGWSGTTVALDTLSDGESAALVALRLRALGESQALAAQLGQTAGGNPLFIEELAAFVRDQGGAPVFDLPTSIKGIIAARLDGLPPGQRSLLLSAAVVGRVFWRGALERLGEGNGGVGRVLDGLEARELIRREPYSRIEGDEEFAFKHILIRDVAYATLTRTARRQRHAAVASFLEEAVGDRVAESASLLAHHWLEAGESERAFGYLIQAAEHARRAWATREAIRLYDQALDLITDDQLRRPVLLGRALAMSEVGDLQQAASELDQLLPQLEGRERCEALYVRANTSFWLADAPGTGRFGRELAELAGGLGDDEYHRLSRHILCLATALDGLLDESIATGEEALVSWPADERKTERSLLLGQIGLNCYWRGDCERSVQVNDAAWKLGLEVNSLNAFLLNGPQVGLALAGLGRHEEAIAHFEWVLAQARELELVPRWTGRAMSMYAGVLYEVFDTQRARALSEEAIELSTQAAFPTARVQAKIDLLKADMAAGETGRAETSWPALWDEAGGLKGWHQWLVRGRLLQAKAEILLALGRTEKAAEAATEATTYWQRYPRPKYEAAGRATLGEALLVLGRIADGVRELERAVDIAERLRHPSSTWNHSAALARALSTAGDDKGATQSAGAAREAIQAVASTLSPERQTTFLQSPHIVGILSLDR
jgi:class 3 adenylate cyclase/tetratricopeptide (TPR) repeat protein